MKKNAASQVIGAQLVSKTDGSAITSGTTTVYVTGDGGTQAAGSVGSGACTHEGNGYWTYTPAQAETNYDQVAFTFVNTSACNVTVQAYPTFPQTGDAFARLGAPAGASIAADLVTIDDFLDTEVAAIKAKTDNLPASPAAVGSAMTLTSGERTSIADATLDRDMATGTDSGGRTVRNALRFLRNKWSISGTTLTVTKEDDSTSAWTSTVTAAPGADPISGNDPS